MKIARPITGTIAKGNLKKSIAFGGTLGAISAGVGLSVVIPTYYAIQKALSQSLQKFDDLSDFLVDLARILGIKPGEDFQTDLENGYVAEITAAKEDGSMTIVFRKTGAPATLIINIDPNGNLSSAGEIYGPAASDILNSINSAAEIFENDANAMDSILDSVNKEIDYNSLRVEYVLRRKLVEDDLLARDQAGTLPTKTFDEFEWEDFGIAALLIARNIKNAEGTYNDTTDPSIVADLKDPAKSSSITDTSAIASIEDLRSFITDETYPILEEIAKKIIDLEVGEKTVFEADGLKGLEAEVGDAFDAAANDLEQLGNEIQQELDNKAAEIVQDINDAKDVAVAEKAAEDETLLLKLIEKPSLWMPAYLKTNTLRNPIKDLMISKNLITESNFNNIVSRISKYAPGTNNVKSLSIIDIANTYDLVESTVSGLVGLRMDVTYNDDSRESDVLLANSSSKSVNDFQTLEMISNRGDASKWETTNLFLDLYYERPSEVLWRNAVNQLKLIANNTTTWTHPKNDSSNPVEGISRAYRVGNRLPAGSSKRELFFSNLDTIALGFYLEGQAINFSYSDYVNVIDALDNYSNSDRTSSSTSTTSASTLIAEFSRFIEWFTKKGDSHVKVDFKKFFKEFDAMVSRFDSRGVNSSTKSELEYIFNNDWGWEYIQREIASNNIENGIIGALEEFVEPSRWTDLDYTWRKLFLSWDVWELATPILAGNESQNEKAIKINEYLYFMAGGELEDETVEKIDKSQEIISNLLAHGFTEEQADEILVLMRKIIKEDAERIAALHKWEDENPGTPVDQYNKPLPLTNDEVEEIVNYTSTVFDVSVSDDFAFEKLKAVFSDNDGDKLKIFENVQKIITLNEWVTEIKANLSGNQNITTDMIEDYVWHKDPVDSLPVVFDANGTGAGSSRGLLVATVYSPTRSEVWSVMHTSSNNYAIKMSRSSNDESVTTAYAFPSDSWTANASMWDDGTDQILVTVELSDSSTDRKIWLRDLNSGDVHTTIVGNSPTTRVRGTAIASNGRLLLIGESGETAITDMSVANMMTNKPANVGAGIIIPARDPDPGSYGSTVVNVEGKDYLVIASQFQNNDTGDQGSIYIHELNGTLARQIRVPTNLSGLSPDNTTGMVYAINGLGNVFRIDIGKAVDGEPQSEYFKEIIRINELTANQVLGSTKIWGSTGVTSDEWKTPSNGFRNIFYNPLTTEITIYGAGNNPRDIYIPNKSIELFDIFGYLIL